MPRVLLVDDNEFITRAVSRLLRQLGWDVRIACDPVSARDHYAHVDVVLSDWSMPLGGGARVVAESPVPVAVYSADEDVPHSPAIAKPASVEVIHAELLALLGPQPRQAPVVEVGGVA